MEVKLSLLRSFGPSIFLQVVNICVVLILIAIGNFLLYHFTNIYVDGCIVKYRTIIVHVPDAKDYVKERSNTEEDDRGDVYGGRYIVFLLQYT